MTDTLIVRPDMDIDADVIDIILRYPPLVSDRHHIQVKVNDGVVSFIGHTSNPINRGYLVDRVMALPGVVDVNAEALYDDVNISLATGQVLPTGVIANTYYGTVVLSGKAPADVDTVAMRVAQVPGVVRVVTTFGEAVL
ncbi:hypothetical protein BAC2_01874 [uncultured bacterium]|nr:hypothetical protein BAC2_01874 [uncultured bacterium]